MRDADRYIAAGSHPDHDTLATFRRRFLGELEALFVQVLELAQEMKLLKLGTVCLDGTKLHANASRHSALSHGHIQKLEIPLNAEVQALLALAEQADQANVPDGVSLPEEIKRREDRMVVMAEAKRKLAVRAEERYQREKAEYDEKMARRAAKEKDNGKKPGGKPPKAPEAGPKDSARSISPTKNRASCRWLAAASNKLTTPRQRWTPRRCWWLPRMSRRPPMTRNRSCRCWQYSRRSLRRWERRRV